MNGTKNNAKLGFTNIKFADLFWKKRFYNRESNSLAFCVTQ